MRQQTDDHYPAWQAHSSGHIDQRVDEARRVLWRAYQRGSLSEEEFAITLDRLEVRQPTAGSHPAGLFVDSHERIAPRW